MFLTLIIYLVYPLYDFYKPESFLQNSDASSTQLRIIQQNCWGRNEDAGLLISMIKEKKPDIIFLQECSPKLFQEIQKLKLSQNYDIYAQFEINEGRLFDNRLVILARGFDLIKKIDNTIMPLYQVFLKERDGNNRIINLINVHLERPHLVDLDYYERFMGLLKQDVKSIILAGDFNLVSWSKQLGHIVKKLSLYDSRKGQGLSLTYPACFPSPNFKVLLPPIFPLDSILISSHFSVYSFEILPFIGSDHYGVQVDLTWRLSNH